LKINALQVSHFSTYRNSVIPVKTGIQLFFKGFPFLWIPASAGMTAKTPVIIEQPQTSNS
jgi:hypothetical protein